MVEIVLLDDEGREVVVDGPSNEISFFFPLLPNTPPPTPLTRTNTDALGACIDGNFAKRRTELPVACQQRHGLVVVRGLRADLCGPFFE